MSMEHKAFVFDYEAFDSQLSGILYEALATSNVEPLIAFIRANREHLKDPYEGEPLPQEWAMLLTQRDAQEYGDVALTKFYEPGRNIGLAYKWQEVEELLNQEVEGGTAVILGQPFGPPGNYFDPGRMGAYFQSSAQVRSNLALLEELRPRKPELSTSLNGAIDMMRQAAQARRGLYVTF